jgi:hypothetical protein
MLIARVGNSGGTWAAAYEFPTLKAIDEWAASRSAVVQRVSGAGGEFDFFGEDKYPIDPLLVEKKFTLQGSNYGNVETLLNTLRDETIARGGSGGVDVGLSRLWGLWRDGTTRVWTFAKCISMKAVETAADQTSVLMNVIARFRCQTGVWYGETEGLEVDTFPIPGGGTVSDLLSVTNAGNTEALVRIAAVPASNTITEMDAQVVPSGGGGAFSQWNYLGNVSTNLVVDARLYQCTVSPGVDSYVNLTPGTVGLLAGGTIPQVAWLWLPSGAMDINLEATHSAGGGSLQVTAQWWDTYVL